MGERFHLSRLEEAAFIEIENHVKEKMCTCVSAVGVVTCTHHARSAFGDLYCQHRIAEDLLSDLLRLWGVSIRCQHA